MSTFLNSVFRSSNRNVGGLRVSKTAVPTHEDNDLANWMECTNLLTGEKFYLNKETGNASDQIPGMKVIRKSVVKPNMEEDDQIGEEFEVKPDESEEETDILDGKEKVYGVENALGISSLEDALVILHRVRNDLGSLLNNTLLTKELDQAAVSKLSSANEVICEVLEAEEDRATPTFHSLNTILDVAHQTSDFEDERCRIFREKMRPIIEKEEKYAIESKQKGSPINSPSVLQPPTQPSRSSSRAKALPSMSKITNMFSTFKFKDEKLSAIVKPHAKELPSPPDAELVPLEDKIRSRTETLRPSLNSDLPRHFSDLSLLENIALKTIPCTVHLTNTLFTISQNSGALLNVNEYPEDLIHQVLKNAKSRGIKKVIENDKTVFALKAKGVQEYFYGLDRPFLDYHYIREMLNREVPIEFVLVDRKYEIENGKLTDPKFKIGEYKVNDLSSPKISSRKGKKVPYSQVEDCTLKVRISEVSMPQGQHFPAIKLSEKDSKHSLSIQIKLFFFYGTTVLYKSPFETLESPFSKILKFNDWIFARGKDDYTIKIGEIPRELRVGIIVYARSSDNTDQLPVAWTQSCMYDDENKLINGSVQLDLFYLSRKFVKSMKDLKVQPYDFMLRMNTGDACIKHGSLPDYSARNRPRITLTFEYGSFSSDCEFQRMSLKEEMEFLKKHASRDKTKIGREVSWDQMPQEMRLRIENVINNSQMYGIDDTDKQVIWASRSYLRAFPRALPKFLQSVDWTNPDHRNEACRCLLRWKTSSNFIAYLELLGPEFPDSFVRDYAVDNLSKISDLELKDLLPQLVQVIKFEICDFSQLALFLISRGISNPILIGNDLFWHLKFETHRPMFSTRYGLILESFLTMSGPYALEYLKQFQIIQRLQRISEMVASLSRSKRPKSEIISLYRQQLDILNEKVFSVYGFWRNPLNPSIKLTTLKTSKCRYMSSKMAPLWLVFNNFDTCGEDVNIIMKVGDDIRQDILTVQHFRLFERIWWEQNLDLKLSPYVCIPTGITSKGRGVGLIEVVKNSETTSRIHWKYGGRFGALQKETLNLYLEDQNPTPAQYEKAVQNFTASCAGYCVATFILGIGDRHNGNIMIKREGHLFHIDFGHILGNFKSKAGIKRERAAFVFTPEMAFIVANKSRKMKNNENYQKFLDMCVKGYQLLREHSNSWMILHKLMVSAGIPELEQIEDIEYMLEILMESASPAQAEKRILSEIDKSVNTTWRLVDNLIHTWVHEA